MAQIFNFQYSRDCSCPNDEAYASLPSDTSNHPRYSKEHLSVPTAPGSYLSYNNQEYTNFQSNADIHLQDSEWYPNLQPAGNSYDQYCNQVPVNNRYSPGAHQQYSGYIQEFSGRSYRPSAPHSYHQPRGYKQEYTNAPSNQNLPQTAAVIHRIEIMTRKSPVIEQSYSQYRQQAAMPRPPMTDDGPASRCQQRLPYQKLSTTPDPLDITGGITAMWQPEQQQQSTRRTPKSPITFRKPLIAIYVDLTVDEDEAPIPLQAPPKLVKKDRSQMSWLKPSNIHLEKALGTIDSVKDEEDHRRRMEIWNNNNRLSNLNSPALAITRKRKASTPLVMATKRNRREKNDSDQDGESELDEEHVRQNLPWTLFSNTMESESDRETVRADSVIEQLVITSPRLKTSSAPEKPKTEAPRKPRTHKPSAPRSPKKSMAARDLTGRNTQAGKIGNHDNDACNSDTIAEDEARENALEEIAAECERMLDELDEEEEEEDRAKVAQTEDEIVAVNLPRLQVRLDEDARQRAALNSESEKSEESEESEEGENEKKEDPSWARTTRMGLLWEQDQVKQGKNKLLLNKKRYIKRRGM